MNENNKHLLLFLLIILLGIGLRTITLRNMVTFEPDNLMYLATMKATLATMESYQL